MMSRTYSKTQAQRRTIEGLFSIMLQDNPREAELLVIDMQKRIRARLTRREENVG